MPATLAKSGGLFLAMIIALFGMAQAQDTAFAVHMGIMALAALIAALAVMKGANLSGQLADNEHQYDDAPVRWGVIATTFWGVVGLLAGLRSQGAAPFPDHEWCQSARPCQTGRHKDRRHRPPPARPARN
jgi:cytochrome c oxidase cbb3-type subunit 1